MSGLSLALQESHGDDFSASHEMFNGLLKSLSSTKSLGMDHSDLEKLLQTEGRELLRRLFEEQLKLRGNGFVGAQVEGSDKIERGYKRESTRTLKSVFGEVSVDRLGYSKPGEEVLFPKDAVLNLPQESYSLGVRKLIAIEASKGSYDEAISSVKTVTGLDVPKRQAEQLAKFAAQDFENFYASYEVDKAEDNLLILTMDGKGIVMRKEGLTEETRARAEASEHKLGKRLSKGEKANRKRMATVASVYEIASFVRTPDQICTELAHVREATAKRRPKPKNKRVWASVERSAENITEEAFTEVLKCDPKKKKKLVCLVDGDPRQIGRIEKEGKTRGLPVTIICDIIHVIEYLWKASRVLNEETSKEAEEWVSHRLYEVLNGKCSDVAGGIRRSATLRGIPESKREPIDKCADYLINKSSYLKYDEYLRLGYPIATGVIEGACRYLIKDRLDITGARWSLSGAEVILKLRSLRASGDFDEYWAFHEKKELERNHTNKYVDGKIPSGGLKLLKK
ncbi:MAG: ISKra4 family transposase [Planctomycetota bacterium]